MPEPQRSPEDPLRKGLWFLALWAAGVATVAIVAYGIRLMIL